MKDKRLIALAALALLALGAFAAYQQWPIFFGAEPPATELLGAVEKSVEELAVPEFWQDFPGSRRRTPSTLEGILINGLAVHLRKAKPAGYTISNRYKHRRFDGEASLVYDLEVSVEPLRGISDSPPETLQYGLEVTFVKRGKLWYHSQRISAKEPMFSQIAGALEKAKMATERAEEKRREEETKRRLAQAATREKQRAIDEAQDREAEQIRIKARALEREAELKERAERMVQENKRAAEENRRTQSERAELAANVFAKTPPFSLPLISTNLKARNVALELRGKDLGKLREIQALLQKREYLKVIGQLLEKPAGEFPPPAEIERAFDELKKLDLQIFAKSKIVASIDSRLFLLSFAEEGEGVMKADLRWERHPDGTGYVHDWPSSDGPLVVVGGSSQSVEAPIWAANQAAREQVEYLRKKKELGEITEATLQERAAELKKSNREKMLKWALAR